MMNFKLDGQINGISNQEILKESLWSDLEKAIPDAQHSYNEKLGSIREKYEFISYEDAVTELNGLGTNANGAEGNRIRGLSYTKDIPSEQCLFMKARRSDGSFAYAVIGAGSLIKYRADFFSPAFFEGHAGNHDFNASELLESLYNAENLPPAPPVERR